MKSFSKIVSTHDWLGEYVEVTFTPRFETVDELAGGGGGAFGDRQTGVIGVVGGVTGESVGENDLLGGKDRMESVESGGSVDIARRRETIKNEERIQEINGGPSTDKVG